MQPRSRLEEKSWEHMVVDEEATSVFFCLGGVNVDVLGGQQIGRARRALWLPMERGLSTGR